MPTMEVPITTSKTRARSGNQPAHGAGGQRIRAARAASSGTEIGGTGRECLRHTHTVSEDGLPRDGGSKREVFDAIEAARVFTAARRMWA